MLTGDAGGGPEAVTGADGDRATPPPAPPQGGRGRRIALPVGAAHAVAVVCLAGAVVAQIARPLAPDVGVGAAPAAVFDPAYLALAQAYRQPLYAVAAGALMIRLGVVAAVALSAWGRRRVARVVDHVGGRRPARAAALVTSGVVIAADLAVLPLAFWAGYVHDGAYGLRTQGLAGWVYDWAVVHVPVWLALGVATAGGYWAVRRLPGLWVPLGGLVVGLLGGLVTFVSPLLLEPLMYRFEPLPAGETRAAVERVLAAAEQPVDAILVADASRRTTRQNAYLSGLGASRRVVLYDTLVRQRPADEVAVVMAHELGHHHNRDIARAVALAVAGGVVGAYVLGWVLRRRVATGRQTEIADPRAAAVVVLVVVLLNLAGAPVQSVVSRRAEAAADLLALEYTESPETYRRMQSGLTRANLAEPRPPRVVTWWWGTHPPTMQRLALADWWQRR